MSVSKVSEEYKKYLNIPTDKWPFFELLWDVDPKNYINAFDGFDKKDFANRCPNGLILGFVPLSELNSKLASHCVSTKEAIWELHNPDKLAKVILFWEKGNKMTPPFLCFHRGELIIAAGFHRHAVCIVKEPQSIPILIVPAEKNLIEKIIPSIKWQQ